MDTLEKNKMLKKQNRYLLDVLLKGTSDVWGFKRLQDPTAYVTIAAITGKKLKVPVNTGFTIKDIKLFVESNAGIPYFSQRLIFAARQVENHHSLVYYHITSGSVLHLVFNVNNQKSYYHTSLTLEQKKEQLIDKFDIDELSRKVLQIQASEESWKKNRVIRGIPLSTKGGGGLLKN